MIISIIAAVADNGIIGRDNRMPWHLPADMRYFRRVTMGKPVLMGRKTFESIGDKPLPGRTNIVVSSAKNLEIPGVLVANSVAAALAAAATKDDAVDEVMIMGGSSFYEQLMPRAHRFYLTEVHSEIEGDAAFPEFARAEWQEVSRSDYPADGENPYPYSFVVLERL